MSVPCLRRAFTACASFALALAWVAPGIAQVTHTMEVLETTFDRDVALRPETQGPNWISHADCVADDKIYLTVNWSGTASGSLLFQVWAGISADCTDPGQRSGDAATCWLIYAESAGSQSGQSSQAAMRTQDIVARRVPDAPGPTGPGSGTVADCENGAWPSSPTDVTLWFMMVGVDGFIPLEWGFDNFTTKVDVHGPRAPDGVTAGIGESQVILDWNEGASGDDVAGYNFYCVPMGGATTSPAYSPLIHDGGLPHDDAGAGDAAATGGSAGATATGGAGGAGATGGTSGTTGGGGNPACPTPLLVPGQRPDESLRCGSVTGQFISGGSATGLANSTTYAIAVAGRDTVNNVGPLSEVVCGTPQPVEDFFERYRAAGGQGGGGFCAIGARPAPGALVACAAAALAFVLRRRKWSRGAA